MLKPTLYICFRNEIQGNGHVDFPTNSGHLVKSV